MLRAAASALLRPAQIGAASAAAFASSSAPTVFDRMVQIFVIDRSGVRHTVRGLEGASLASTLSGAGVFSADAFMPHVFDPAHPDCHVYVQGDYLDKLAPLSEEQRQEQARVMEHAVRDRAQHNSRMGHFITLSPALNGMTVALGDIEPWETQ